jgi:gliding motility-associated-like protein
LKQISFIVTGLFLSLLAGISQNVSMPNVVNHFLKVTAVGPDRVTVVSSSEITFFQPGDKVLLIQMTGTTLPPLPNVLTYYQRFKQAWNNAGMYEILQVDEISGNDVVFTDDISRTYTPGEKIQLVRIVEGDNVTITSAVNAAPWDGNTGGIVAIIGMDSVILKASISANNAGFRGGTVPAENYTGGCRKDVSSVILDTLYFTPAQTNRSGNKGEGIITTAWNYTKGMGFAINGGGAGNGLYSGGAGGSNLLPGGDGGQQSATCTDYLSSAWGGGMCKDLYELGRVIMGGGGGTGVKSATNTASNGGNGGGIVMIITGVLDVRNGSSITSNGQTISSTVTGSGGGGGAGGTVLMDVTSCPNSFWVRVKGGGGGKVAGPPCTGSGGGGSGGVFWHSGSSFPMISVDSSLGTAGYTASCLITAGSPGSVGGRLKNLLTPLTGFLFNSIHGVDTLCAGQTLSNPLTGSQPKGGDGNYDLSHWEQSTDNVNWVAAVGSATLRTFSPPALTQTTWYRRIVISASTYDTSKTIEIKVYPVISNNIISGTDTICFDMYASKLTGTSPAGGNTVYQYGWQFSADQGSWSTLDSTNSSLYPGALQHTRFFRRLVTSASGLCTHTSNSVKITVLSSITNNDFVSSDTVICKNQGPGLLNAKTPADGDGSYSYQWQNKALYGSWTSIPASNVLRFNPGILTDTIQYRRIVFSGNGQVCKDTSGVKTIHVLPALSNNLISSDTNRYCAGSNPALLKGSQPLGGNGTYIYKWLSGTPGNWLPVNGGNLQDCRPEELLETNIQFRRLITSGEYSTCRDTSAAFLMDVVPYISNRLNLDGQTICENSTPAPMNPGPATGGLGSFTYQWYKSEEGGPWVIASLAADQISFAPGSLAVSTQFVRDASSDICSLRSDTVSVTVYPAISNNTLLGGDVQYTCYNSGKSIAGSTPAQGSGSYLYLWEQSDNNADWTPVSLIPESDFRNLTSAPFTATRYFRRIVWSSPNGHECKDTSGSVEVRINPLPSGDVIAGVDTLCAGEPLQVRFTTAGLHPPFSVTIGGSTKEGITASPDSLTIVPLSTQSIAMIKIEDDSGCVADYSGYSKVARAVVYEVPVAQAGTDDEICSNTYALQATKSIAASTGSWTASAAAFSDPSDPNSNVTIDQYGSHTFTWTENNWHCSDDAQVQVVFFEQPQIPDAGPDQTLDFVYSAQLTAMSPSVGSGKWTVVSGAATFSNDTLPDAGVSELDVSNTLQWTVHNGTCAEVSDRVDIKISPLVLIKAFTPNGDTKNDYFDLGARNAEKISIKIYNSTGILVFESENYQETDGWDGKNMNGVEVPEGTYFYVADIKVAGRGKGFQYRSFVEILR